jgi:hypothetical protein
MHVFVLTIALIAARAMITPSHNRSGGVRHSVQGRNLRPDAAARPANDTKVKEAISACSVSTSQYVPYLNSDRQLYKLSREQGISCESFAMAAQVLLDKWAARGCDPKVLAKIRTEFFDISAPRP